MSIFKSKSKISYDPSKVYAAINGTVKTLASLKDGVFSEKMMGDGVVLALPAGTKTIDIFSPIEGELQTVFPTGHAYGVRSKQGVEVLVHLGIDTVNLNGEGFEKHVSQGKKVKVGDRLATMNVELIGKRAPTCDVIMIVTSSHKISDITKGEVRVSQELFTVKE